MPAPSKTLEGLDQTFKNLDHLGLNLASCVRTACWKLGGKILWKAKKRCPQVFTGTPSWDPDPGTPTGRLMGSLTMRSNFSGTTTGFSSPAKQGDEIQSPPTDASKMNPEVVVGTNVEYAQFPEFGTKKMYARPYLYPAFFEHSNEFEKILVDIVEKKAALRNFNQRLPIFDPEGNWE